MQGTVHHQMRDMISEPFALRLGLARHHRPTWDLSKQQLGARGWRALQRLLPGTTSLVSLTLPLNPERDGAPLSLSPASDTPQPFFLTRLPAPLGRAFRGTMAFDAGVDYNADKGEFYLVDSRIEELELDEVPGQYRTLVRELANHVLGRYLDQLAVYRLDPDDFEESLAKLVLKEVAVEGGRLVLHIGLL